MVTRASVYTNPGHRRDSGYVLDVRIHLARHRVERPEAREACRTATKQLGLPATRASAERLGNTAGNDEAPADPEIHRGFSVDIVYLCSNRSSTSVTTAQIREISGAIGDPAGSLQPRVKRGWNRLSDEDQAVVVARYKDGATSTALAADFGVAKSTILRILRDARIVVRRQSLTLDQVTEAARLYESGLSLSQVARHLDVNQETMRVAIIATGITLRPPTGR